jgi:hypothetical protein
LTDPVRVSDWLTPQAVGQMVGFSAGFIRSELEAGVLPGVYVCRPPRKVGRWKVYREDAIAYARQLGVYRTSRA